MPTAKRARQKAARQQKRAVEQKRAKRRKLGRTAAFVGVGGAVILVIALATAGVFSSSSPPKKTAGKGKSTTTTTAAATTTTAAAGTTTTTGATTTTATATNATAQAAANAAAVAAGCPATTKTRVNTLSWSAAPALTITKSKTYTAAVKTTAGTFTITLDAKTAPTVVNNFVFLAKQGYYKCNIFHRVIPGFMDQTGDPTGTGNGSPGYKFANQNVPTSYAPYEVAMANSGGTDTNGSQFFILATGGQTTLNGDLSQGDKYALFGTVTSGTTVVAKINSEGNSNTNGTPPLVTQRILTVTISTS